MRSMLTTLTLADAVDKYDDDDEPVPSGPGEEHWVTINGNHILIGADGEPKAGQPRAYGSTTAAEQQLTASRSRTVTSAGALGGGVTAPLLLRMDDGSKLVFKPAANEPKEILRGNVTPGFATEREVAAWEVAKAVGIEDLVVPAAVHTFGSEQGVAMPFQEGTVAKNIDWTDRYDGAEDLCRAAVFDYVIGNEDRHPGNWILDNGARLRLIDHGLAFPDKGEYGKLAASNHAFTNAIWARSQNHRLPDPRTKNPKAYTRTYIKNRAAILAACERAQLPAAAIQGVAARIDSLKKITTWSKLP